MTAEAKLPAASVLLVGCGRMGGALLRAWRDGERRLYALDPSATAIEGAAVVDGPAAIADLPRPLIIVLAVKPALIETVAGQIGSHCRHDDIVVSIAAGVALDALTKALGQVGAVLRAMPNTGVDAKAGATALVAGRGAGEAAMVACEALFGAVGLVVRLEAETLMDEVTALSGSGPAYFFAFAEALASAAQREGLPAATAQALARQTLIGAGALAAMRYETLADLREEVTSPGGTTAAGLGRLADRDALSLLTHAAVAAAAARSRDLGLGAPVVVSGTVDT